MSEPYKIGTKLWNEGRDGKPVEFTVANIQYTLTTDNPDWVEMTYGRYPIRHVSQEDLIDRGFCETPYELRKAQRAKLEAKIAECQAELAALVATDEA